MGCCGYNSLNFLELTESIITDYHLYYNISLTIKIKLETEKGLNEIKKEEIKNNQGIKGKGNDKSDKLLYEIILKDYLDEKIDGTELFDKKWYNDFEKDKIVYSKRSILALINQAFEDKNNEFEEFNLIYDNSSSASS